MTGSKSSQSCFFFTAVKGQKWEVVMDDQNEFKTRQKKLKKEIEQQEDDLKKKKNRIKELKDAIKCAKQAIDKEDDKAHITTLESELQREKIRLSEIKAEIRDIKAKIGDIKVEITGKRREYYVDFLYYHQKESPKLFYGVMTFSMTVLGAIVLFVKFMPDRLFLIDYAEPLDFFIGGLLNLYFWASIILFAIVYWLVPKIKLNRYNPGRPNKRIGLSISWLYAIHKAPGCYATLFAILILPSMIRIPWATASVQFVQNAIGISPHYVHVDVSSPQECLSNLIPVYRLFRYQVFKRSPAENSTVIAIPIKNIAAIQRGESANASSTPTEEDAQANPDNLNNSVCQLSKSIKNQNPIPVLPILLSSSGYQEPLTTKVSVTNQAIENLSRTILTINYQGKVDYAYIENFLSQEKGKSYRIRKELPTVYFQHDEPTIDEPAINGNADRTIEKIVDLLRDEAPGTDLLIVGYANTQGTPSYNQRLSKRRSTAVRKKLKRALENDENSIISSYFNIYDEGIGDKNYEFHQSLEGPTNRRARVFIVEPVPADDSLPNSKFKAAMNND
jgi:outer membrane protein OmpA-like peptidoglycan-associated protein